MDEKQFLDIYCDEKYYNRTISKEEKGMPVRDMKHFKKLTELIDYGCKFDKKGICQKKKHNTYQDDNPQMCCCSGCGVRVGYLENISYSDLSIYAQNFDKKFGFWSNEGCTLPRELRSETCLCHSCKDLEQSANNLFLIIRDGNKAMDSYNKIFCTCHTVYDHLKERLEKDRVIEHG